MKKKISALIISLSLVSFLSGCDLSSSSTDDDGSDTDVSVSYGEAYDLLKSYMYGYRNETEDSYGERLLFERPTKYTIDFLSYDKNVYDSDGNLEATYSLIPAHQEYTVNTSETYIHSYGKNYEKMVDDHASLTSYETTYYESSSENAKYEEHFTTAYDIYNDLTESDEYDVEDTKRKTCYEGYGSYQDYIENCSGSVYKDVTNYVDNEIKNIYNWFFVDKETHYVFTKEVSLEGEIFSFHFTWQRLENEWYAFEGTLDSSTGTLEWVMDETYVYYHDNEIVGADYTISTKHVLSFADEGFDIPYSFKDKEYEEIYVQKEE